MVAKLLGKGAGIYAGNHWDIIFFQPFVEGFFCIPVRIIFAVFADY